MVWFVLPCEGRWTVAGPGSGLQMESARARVCQIHFCMQDEGLRGYFRIG